MSEDAYRTVTKMTTGLYKDRGSKFIGYLFPVETEEQFHKMLQKIKNEHFKARHHCTAIRLRSGLERASDDGEPSGSAGKPMLNQLLSADIVDVGAVCVRYFGGTKLGVSGLIAAYKGAVAEAVNMTDIVIRYETTNLTIKFDYSVMGTLLDTLKQLNVEVSEKLFNESPSVVVRINQSEVPAYITRIKAQMIGRPTEDITADDEIPGVTFGESNDSSDD